jgi:hypothetical protein
MITLVTCRNALVNRCVPVKDAAMSMHTKLAYGICEMLESRLYSNSIEEQLKKRRFNLDAG